MSDHDGCPASTRTPTVITLTGKECRHVDLWTVFASEVLGTRPRPPRRGSLHVSL